MDVVTSGLEFFLQKPSCHLYGSLCVEGMTADWHNLSSRSDEERPQETGPTACGLSLCLNLSGHGSVQGESGSFVFAPHEVFLYNTDSGRMQIKRREKERHRYLSIGFSSVFLRDQLGVCLQSLHPGVRAFLCATPVWADPVPPEPLAAGHRHLLAQLLQATEDGEQGRVRSKGILLQLMADFLVRPCCKQRAEWSRKKCLASERTQKVVAILQRDLAAPPTLEALGREVGCSPYYLSRTFSREMGVTIQLYMRSLRICHAAALLKGGRCNVTEAAMATGYSSLSHFSQAFFQTMGCCPTDYALQAADSEKAPCTPAFLKELFLPGESDRLVSVESLLR